jgi:opacity protein-like surface antigen
MDFIIKPKIFIGPEYSFLLDAKIEYIEQGNSQAEIDEKDHFKQNEYGIILGAGAEYELQSGKIIFDVRYNYGLKNINIIEQGSEIKSNTISFNLGFAFSL